LANRLTPPSPPPGFDVPDWALPQSAPTSRCRRPPISTHLGAGGRRHRSVRGADRCRGRAGAGSASYDAASKIYTINSAGYNIWYQRDEFHYLWKMKQ